MTDLLKAIQLDQSRMIEVMLQIPGTVSHQTLNDALILACRSGQAKIVRLLLGAGADPNAADRQGNSVLSLSVAASRTADVTDTLLDHGAEVQDTRALHQAAKTGNSEAVEALLRRGAKVDARDGSGSTALMLAARYTNSMETVSGILLEHGASVNAQDRDLNTALHYAVVKLRGIETLVRSGARTDMANADGNTALMYAATEGLCSVIRVLMTSQCDVNTRNMAGKTAMHILAMKGHECCVGELLRHGGDVNVRDNDGITPLEEALQRQQVMTSRILLQYNADLPRDYVYMTELLLHGHHDLVKLLVASGAKTAEIKRLMTSYRTDVTDDMVTWLDDVMTRPRTLLDQSRFLIRRSIGAKNFSDHCDGLPLPRYLKDILLFIDLKHHLGS